MGPPWRTESVGFGDAQARDTLALMVGEVQRGLGDDLTRTLARRILYTSDLSDRVAVAATLRCFLADHYRFVPDARGPWVDLIRTPHAQANAILNAGEAAGDCDDLAVLGATLGRLAGLAARFVAVGFQGPDGPLSHVWAEVATPLGWLDLDVTRPQGNLPPVTRRRVVPVA